MAGSVTVVATVVETVRTTVAGAVRAPRLRLHSRAGGATVVATVRTTLAATVGTTV
jgi:hypothetical protein